MKLHQEIRRINPLNATRPGGGLSRHLDAEPPSNPLGTGWACRTLISKTPHYRSWKEPPNPSRNSCLPLGLTGLTQTRRDTPSPAQCPKGPPRSRLATGGGFLSSPPPHQPRGTQRSRSEDPWQRGHLLAFPIKGISSQPSSKQPWQVFYYSQVLGEETEAPQ